MVTMLIVGTDVFQFQMIGSWRLISGDQTSVAGRQISMFFPLFLKPFFCRVLWLVLR